MNCAADDFRKRGDEEARVEYFSLVPTARRQAYKERLYRRNPHLRPTENNP